MGTDKHMQTRTASTARPSLEPVSSALLQRKCACGGTGSEGGCEECKKAETLQRRSTGYVGPSNAPPIVHEVLRSPGHPLDHGSRSFFEPRFGYDFGRVRIHTDDRAAASARAVNAMAYTVGHQLVFESGRFDPHSISGQKLIAHELAHVIQQSGQHNSNSELTVTPAHDAFEYDADRAAQKALAGGEIAPSVRRHSPALQRQLPPTSPGPPTMGGPDWGLTCDILQGKCSFNTPAGDMPIEKEHYRCVLLAKEGRCPPECEDELKPLNIPCVRPRTPGKNPPGREAPPLPECPPGEIFISGKCLPFRRPDQTTMAPPPQQQTTPPSPQQQTTPSPQFQLGGAPSTHVRMGTVESETLGNFALNDPQVPSQHAGQLDHLAGLLNVYRDVEVHIEGHTDGSGTESINNPLSSQRAEAVKAQLIQRHVINPARLKTQGFSSHQPQVTPQSATAQEPRNRRVEVWFYTPPSKPMGEGLRMDTKP